MIHYNFSGFEIVYPNYEITREADEKVKTYLDTFGRPVLVFSAKNLEENHIKNIEVRRLTLIKDISDHY